MWKTCMFGTLTNNIVLGSTFCSQIKSLMWIANSASATRLQQSEISLCESSNQKQIKVCDIYSNNVNTVSRIPSDGWTIVVSFCPQTWTGSVGMWPLKACTPSARQRWSSCSSVSLTRRPSPKTSSPTLCSSTRRPSPVRIAPPGGPQVEWGLTLSWALQCNVWRMFQPHFFFCRDNGDL